MYRLIVRAMARRAFRLLSAGRVEEFLQVFDDHSRFWFVGDHVFGGERVGRDAIRPVIEEMHHRFRDLDIRPRRILVNGWPWNTTVATALDVRATTLDGAPYRNHGMQLLVLRWGRVVEDRVYEDVEPR
jgi:ketosteroid isomerase-like protein